MRREFAELIHVIELIDQHMQGDERLHTVEVFHRLTEACTRTVNRLFPEVDWRIPHRVHEDLHGRLAHIDRRLDQILDVAAMSGHCPWESNCNAEQFPNFLTALNDAVATAHGTTRFKAQFNGWFNGARASIVDPYIFSSGQESLTTYCNTVVDAIGATPSRIEFFYRQKGYHKPVADRIFNQLNASGNRDIYFYCCDNIHDRVWMQHYDDSDTPTKKGWAGRVVGTSVNGMSTRPTYIIEMPSDDAADYSTYLHNLRTSATLSMTPP